MYRSDQKITSATAKIVTIVNNTWFCCWSWLSSSAWLSMSSTAPSMISALVLVAVMFICGWAVVSRVGRLVLILAPDTGQGQAFIDQSFLLK